MLSRLIRGWGKKKPKDYPAVKGMLRVFLSSRHDDFGNSIKEILESYMDYRMPVTDAWSEINSLLLIEDDNELNDLLTEMAGNEFCPEFWGETWRSFLHRVVNILNSAH